MVSSVPIFSILSWSFKLCDLRMGLVIHMYGLEDVHMFVSPYSVS